MAYAQAQPVYLTQTPPKTEITLSQGDSAMFAGFPDLLTVQHMSWILGQCEKTVRKLCREGALPSIEIGERIYVPKARLIEYVAGGCNG